ncbi:hypothetical protein ACYATL_08955 [Actinotignum timonense]|uniref:hypothetical protein n=1 Tax=Actinotignum TaxID=1653174 RepID=UPI00237E65FC|nr:MULTISPECIES: hypothetical protein [Actinotignum]MDE1654746.1 hypothetical protein [Actinotignum schaalii]MDK6905673.1 hypothetical protein [Actinotignum timonense]MDK8782827.1 hypothetical protein [Actinotignum timonense]MDY5137895.1 hypothetical protein [Actinotignum timonense]
MKRSIEEMLDEVENANGGEGPDPIATVDDPYLAQVAVAQIELRAADNRLDAAVARARAAGKTWQAIGDVLGMTRQGANQRFAAA